MTPCCPFCHQTIGTLRFGVRLPRFKAAIVDRIKPAGDLGISTTELINSDLYRDRRAVRPATIKAHVEQINDLLLATDWRIASDHRRWTLVRRRGQPYDAAGDFAKSLEEGYRAIRERVAAGGKGWTPK
jgi:hypothetical protein